MMYTVPTFSFTEPGLVNQLSDIQTRLTPWELDYFDYFSAMPLEPVVPSLCSGESKTDTDSGSEKSCIGSIKTNSGSEYSDCFPAVPSAQSDELDTENPRIRTSATNYFDNNRKKLNRLVSQVTDDQKRKRMESNRESAKRSRMRKQKHIENLRDEVNQLGSQNRELRNCLQTVMYYIVQICKENNRLLSEQEILRQKFLEMRQILILRQLSRISNNEEMITKE